VASAVRDLNRLELAGESVRACLEALAAAAPDWLAGVIDISEWSTRYRARVDSWRLPSSAAKRERLAGLYGSDALALLRAIHAAPAPDWLRELPAVQVLATVLIQNYYIHTNARGREVIIRPGVPQLRRGKSQRIPGLSCGNGAEPNHESCH